MKLTKENLELWIMNNLYQNVSYTIQIASELTSYFGLNTKRIANGINIVREYKETPMLMQEKITELLK